MKNSCDCIIPFYNEELRPIKVVETVLQVKTLSKIIVVDDGSTDQTAFLALKKNFPQIKVIRLEKNSGKANAIKEGLKYATSQYIFLLDGDLTNIKIDELENAILKITANPEIDLLIFRRIEDKTVVLSRWIRHDIIFSGQRLLKRKDLQKIFEKKIIGYNLESAINSYMIRHHKNCYWFPSSVHNLFKHEKWGIKEGFLNKGMLGFIKFMLSHDIIYQTLFFCKKEIK